MLKNCALLLGIFDELCPRKRKVWSMETFIEIERQLRTMDWANLLFWTLVSAAAVQLVYYLFIYSRIAFHKETPMHEGSEGVSVIICARNEIKNLKENLPLILEQNYPNFEVVVVNDSSFDGTKDFLDELAVQNPKLKPVHLDIDERYLKGKKFALTIGIKAASHERMLLTDADCQPLSPDWIREMTGEFSHYRSLVLGVSFFKFNYRPINFISRIESFHTAMQYINFALIKSPFMGVGRNIAYTQKLFFDNKGFASHQHLISGDDDLFVNEVAKNGNYTVRYNYDSQTCSDAKKGLGAYWKQKSRHFSSSKNYKFKHKFLLFLPAFSLFLFWLSAILLLVEGSMMMEALIVVGARLLVQWIVVGINLSKFGKIVNIWTVPLWDPILLLIHLFIGVKGVFSKPQTWK